MKPRIVGWCKASNLVVELRFEASTNEASIHSAHLLQEPLLYLRCSQTPLYRLGVGGGS